MLDNEDIYMGWRNGLAAGRIRVTRCSSCAAVQWYPLFRCPQCRGERWEWADMDPDGRVHSWCRVHRATVGIDGLSAPYVLALVELSQAPGVRIVAVAQDPETTPSVGERVRLTMRDVAGAPRPHFAAAAR